MRWLTETHGIAWKNIVPMRGAGRLVDATYNQGIKLALESDEDEFLFCDRDLFPAPEKTDIFMLEKKFDFQCVKYPTGCAGAFKTPDSFHSGMWRCNRSALEKIGMPVFKWKRTADGTSGIGCHCNNLVRLARIHGLTTGHVGEVFHVPRPQDGLPDVINLT